MLASAKGYYVGKARLAVPHDHLLHTKRTERARFFDSANRRRERKREKA